MPLETRDCQLSDGNNGPDGSDGVTGLVIGDLISTFGLAIVLLIIVIGAGIVIWKVK